ncbi:MAG: type II secretion system F family protein [Candidatus Micrarchaeota archaeon]|nr:type II secretion system F family protein [Candidatus Micrarchaeota archaeon]
MAQPKYDAKAKKVHQPLISQPLRESEGPQDPVQFRNLFISIASYFPDLRKDLIRADMNYTPAGFVRTALLNAFGITAVLLLIVYLLLRNSDFLLLALILAFPILFLLSFFYVMYFPKAKASIRAKKIEQELVFAGRHMLIELKSGVPLFDAMLGISQDYGEVSVEFNKIVEKVTLGVPMGVALHEVAENNPSAYFKRVVLQIANSLSSGADVAVALEAVLDQISKEQIIELKAYGQKLNPLVMFYMIFGIILPSLGIAFLIILVSFLGSAISFGPSALFSFLLALALIQFIFLTMVESSRPKFDMG